MRTVLVILFALCAAVCGAQVQQGYYTAPDMVPHIVKIKNGKMYIEAGGETSVFRNSGGKYVVIGYFYGGNESNMQTPKAKNPPYIVPQSNTSYKYHAYDQVKLYRLDAAKTQDIQILLYDNENLEENEGDTQSEFVEVSLKHVEEIAPNYEKYMKKAKDDPANAQIWLQIAQATIAVSSYTKMNNPLLNDLLLVKAKYIQRTAPHFQENPCPDVIPQEIWEKAKQE